MDRLPGRHAGDPRHEAEWRSRARRIEALTAEAMGAAREWACASRTNRAEHKTGEDVALRLYCVAETMGGSRAVRRPRW
jgi:hypothetical protein